MKVTGWIGKKHLQCLSELESLYDGYSDFSIGEIYEDRGDEGWWNAEDWPPVKVTVTIEKAE